MGRLWLDLETFSEVPIKHGTYRYAESCEIMLFAYAVDDDEPGIVDFTAGETLPQDIIFLVNDPDEELWAHNSMFDRTVLRYQHTDFAKVQIQRWRDTMVQAYSHSLPGSLDKLCEILKVPQDSRKLKTGNSLIHLFCKPRQKNSKLRRATRLTHPEEWEQLKDYAKQDIVAMRECNKRMPTVNYPDNRSELLNWHLDQVINDRGFQVDTRLVEGAITTVADEKEALKQQVQNLTDGGIESCTKRDRVINYILESYGIYLQDLTKATVNKVLDDPDMPDEVREILSIRLQATSTSTSKYAALKKATNNDNRCRGTIQFNGGKRTGRAAGRTFQPQNLPSRGLLSEIETEWGIHAIHDSRLLDYVPMLYSNAMSVLTSAVRGVLVARPGYKLCISDLSNIEGRKAAWIAGENWKLEAFSNLDKGIGHDLYNLAYANSFKVPVESVTKAQRNIGKVQELMLQYAGGVGAFVTGALAYGFDVEKLADSIWDTLPAEKIKEAEDFLKFIRKQKGSTYGLSDKAFITCDVLKRLWRDSNSKISSFWKVLENSIINAICNPGDVFQAGELLYIKRVRNWLLIRLPSGRSLCYAAPQVDERGKISYMGENQHNRKWGRIASTGGKFLENICQASARDTLYYAMPGIEYEGYEIVLHVHDEVVAEAPDRDEFNVDTLSKLMIASTTWNTGLPLAAAGFESYRYRK